MRTTIDIEDDVLAAAKEIARSRHVSAGKVVSELLRRALSGGNERDSTEPVVGGFRPFSSPDQRLVSNDEINRLRDDEGI